MKGPNGHSAGLRLTRRHIIGVSGGMLLATSRPGLAQIPMTIDAEERRKSTMEIKRNGSRPSGKGPEAYFTGTVRVDPVFQVGDPARVSGGHVAFEPGARSAWHTHPLGQTLIVTSGLGWAQTEGGPIEEIRPGDVVWFPANEKHWHGAMPTSAMTHIAIQEALDGKVVDWMEQVSE